MKLNSAIEVMLYDLSRVKIEIFSTDQINQQVDVNHNKCSAPIGEREAN